MNWRSQKSKLSELMLVAPVTFRFMRSLDIIHRELRFFCPPGWFESTKKAVIKINKVAMEFEAGGAEPPQVTLIKEKFAAMSIYTNPGRIPEIDKITRELKLETEVICETCSSINALLRKDIGRWRILCGDCHVNGNYM